MWYLPERLTVIKPIKIIKGVIRMHRLFVVFLPTLFLIFILSCSSTAIKKEPVFFSKNKNEWPVWLIDNKIPICPNKNNLCLDPTKFYVKDNNIKHPPLPENISNSLSDFGKIIGTTEIIFSIPNINDFSKIYYIIKDENVGKLFICSDMLEEKDASFSRRVFKGNVNGKRFEEDYFGIYGELSGIMIFVDLYNAKISDDGSSALMPMKIKNNNNNRKFFDIKQNHATFYINDSKSKKKINFSLLFYNRCLDAPIKSIADFEPYEMREYYIKCNFKNKNESIGFQTLLMFTKILIDGKIMDGTPVTKKELKKLENIWGGNFTLSNGQVSTPLRVQVKPFVFDK